MGASYTTTLVGGLIGAACLLAILPFVRELLRQFGSAEFFILSLMAVIAVAIVSAGAFIKGMLTAAFSMAIAMIGFSPVTGQIRTDFGLTYLWDGIGILPVVVGLFAIPEMIALVASGTPVAKERLRDLEIEASKDVRKGMRTALQHKWLMVRSSLIGVAVGIMPGVGGSAAHWIAYAHARQTEKGARQSFGIGDVRGVIASDSANNSVDGGQLIPTLFFAIPGSAPMAILLAIFILSGITPGPTMLTTNLDMTISLIYIIVLANIIVIPIMLVAAPLFIRLTTIQPKILAPVVIAVVTLAAFQATNSVADLVLVLGFAALGLYMKRYGWPRTPMLIAVVLAEPVEKFLWLSINTIGWSMFARPQFIVLFVILVLMILGSMWALKGGTRAVDDSA